MSCTDTGGSRPGINYKSVTQKSVRQPPREHTVRPAAAAAALCMRASECRTCGWFAACLAAMVAGEGVVASAAAAAAALASESSVATLDSAR